MSQTQDVLCVHCGMEELDATSGRSARRAPWEAATMALLTSVCIQLLFHFTISTTMAPRPRDAPPAPGLLATAFSFVSREIESFVTAATGGDVQKVSTEFWSWVLQGNACREGGGRVDEFRRVC